MTPRSRPPTSRSPRPATSPPRRPRSRSPTRSPSPRQRSTPRATRPRPRLTPPPRPRLPEADAARRGRSGREADGRRRRAATPTSSDEPEPRLVAASPEQDASPSGRTDSGAAAGWTATDSTSRASARGRVGRSRVPFVALTGGMGSGKSTACAALERLGAATISTDAVVHELYGSATVRDAVVARWGEEVAPGGVVDRGAIARHVFGAPGRARVARRAAVAAGRRACLGVQASSRRRPTRRRRPRWWRPRCSSRPAWTASTTRRSR